MYVGVTGGLCGVRGSLGYKLCGFLILGGLNTSDQDFRRGDDGGVDGYLVHGNTHCEKFQHPQVHVPH